MGKIFNFQIGIIWRENFKTVVNQFQPGFLIFRVTDFETKNGRSGDSLVTPGVTKHFILNGLGNNTNVQVLPFFGGGLLLKIQYAIFLYFYPK